MKTTLLLAPRRAAEVMKPYGITETALRRMIKENKIPGTVQVGVKTLINMPKLFDYLGIEPEAGGKTK